MIFTQNHFPRPMYDCMDWNEKQRTKFLHYEAGGQAKVVVDSLPPRAWLVLQQRVSLKSNWGFVPRSERVLKNWDIGFLEGPHVGSSSKHCRIEFEGVQSFPWICNKIWSRTESHCTRIAQGLFKFLQTNLVNWYTSLASSWIPLM